MRRQTFGSTGRRGTVIVASAAVLCLGGALTACGGSGGGEGYTAVGAAGTGPASAPHGAVAPSGSVTLVPLDGGEDGDAPRGNGPPGDTPGEAPASAEGSAPGPGPASTGDLGTGTSGDPDRAAGTASTGGTGGTGGAGGTTTGSGSGEAGGASPGSPGGTSPTTPKDPSDPSTPSVPGTTPPATPAALKLSVPVLAPTGKRWCEQVTMEFRNTGGTAARSGTVSFATHIIGGLGIDWATVRSTQPLPAPIGAGAVRKKTYTVCVDAWRVPLGMRIETQDVTAVWK